MRRIKDFPSAKNFAFLNKPAFDTYQLVASANPGWSEISAAIGTFSISTTALRHRGQPSLSAANVNEMRFNHPPIYALLPTIQHDLGLIQIPWNTEAGFGAAAWDGSTVLNHSLVTELGLTPNQIEESISRTRQIVSERVQKFRGSRPLPNIRDKVVLIIDDGLASGYTMAVAADSVRNQEPQEVIVAVPTGSVEAVRLVSSKADLLICLNIRSGPIFAVADAYEEWYDLTDDEVMRYLHA